MVSLATVVRWEVGEWGEEVEEEEEEEEGAVGVCVCVHV